MITNKERYSLLLNLNSLSLYSQMSIQIMDVQNVAKAIESNGLQGATSGIKKQVV